MKFLYLFYISLFFSVTTYAQDQFEKVVKEYYRVNPFEGNFSSFVQALTTDPQLLSKQITKKTDTTLYFVRGTYANFNPFPFKGKRVDMVFAESAIPGNNLLGKKESILYYNYQILIYADDTKEYRDVIKKEYNKLNKRLKKSLPKTDVVPLKGTKNIEDGEIINYAVDNVYPVTLAWQTITNKKELILTLIVRLSQSNNVAAPLGGYSYYR